jgi:hypothetical protein
MRNKLKKGLIMTFKFIARVLLALVTLSIPISNASAEKVRITDEYYDNVLWGNCMYAFSDRLNARVKIFFRDRDVVQYITETYVDVELKVATPDGNLALTGKNGTSIFQLEVENNQSFMRPIKKKNADANPVYLGSCKTSWSNYKSLPPLPAASVASSDSKSESKEFSAARNKDEIAALEKKLAALKQKSARKEEYQKMRALLDQKLKEVQGQIQMLEQEYKDVLN